MNNPKFGNTICHKCQYGAGVVSHCHHPKLSLKHNCSCYISVVMAVINDACKYFKPK